MRRVVSSATPSTEVDRQLDNTAYENVLAVVRNMASIVAAGANVATYDALLLIQTEIEAIYADIDNVNLVGTDIANVNTLATNIAVLSSLYADKATLDSLFADKATLDSLFTDKATLDSLFASKAVLDSIYADKITLDSLYADKATLDLVAANLADVNNFALVYQIKATAPTVRVDASALQEGDLWFDTTLNVLQKYDGAAYSITTADTIATDAITFTNKTITDPSNEVGAPIVSYDNTISGLSATDAKAALDELTSDKADQATTYTKTETDTKQVGKNLLLNANGNINQEGYVSGTATTSANEYTLDMWKVIALGESLITSGVGGVTTFTAPLNGVEQIIEGINVVSGVHVISGLLTATCTIDGVAKANGDTVTLVGSSNVSVKFFNGTFQLPQLEVGSEVTAREKLRVELDDLLCKRYYERVYDTSAQGYDLTSASSLRTVPWKVQKKSYSCCINSGYMDSYKL